MSTISNKIKIFVGVFVLALFIIGFCGEASSFVLQKTPLLYERWQESDIPHSYRINPSGFPAGVVDAIESAFEAWEDIETADISFTYDGTTPIDTIGNDGTNVILMVTDNWPYTNENGPPYTAYTTVWVNTSTGVIEGADMEFNGVDYAWSTTGESQKWDIQNMATHEIGHFIGIDHNCDEGYPTPEDPINRCQDPSSLTCRPCSAVDRQATMYHVMAAEETDKQTLEPDDL